jgi:hypothetical protein
MVFLSHHLTFALASLSKNYSPTSSGMLIFTLQQFLHLIVAFSHLPLHLVYKMAFILGFRLAQDFQCGPSLQCKI